MKQVYLDYSATTPLAPEVNEAIYEWGKLDEGNPSSPHRFGQKSKVKMEEVRDLLAARIGCQSGEIVFTSGGTESNNLALTGTALASRVKGRHIIINATEHPSVLNSAEHLESLGFEITRIQPDPNGQYDLNELKRAFRADTILVSVMLVNNETGIIHPVLEIGELCSENNIPFHCDAVQAFGKIPFQFRMLKTDLLSVSAHKIYGPKGIGALIIKEGIRLERMLHGGEQEANRRPGTENMTGIAGFGAAVQILEKNSDDYKKAAENQVYFESNLKQSIPDIKIIGENSPRSPYISCISFPGYDNQSLLLNLDLAGIAASVGSACSSGSIKQSHVLKAMGLDDTIINSAVRFSFGRFTEKDGMDYALGQLNLITKRMKKLI